MTPDEKLFDDVISQALDVLRFGAAKRAETMRKLDAMSKEVVAMLQGEELSKKKRKELEAFLTNVEKIVAKHYDIIQDDVEADDLAKTVAAGMADSLQLAMGLDAVNLPKSDYFNSVASNVLIDGSPAADWWRGQEVDTQRRFTGAVRQGLLNGETNQQIIRRLVGSQDEPGAMDITKRNAASLVQTSVQAVANDARRATFDANDDVIKGLRQVSTLDSHTSPVCMAYSGASWNMKREPLNGSPPFNGGCPRHFNCRSVEVPITKTFRELGLDIDEPMPTTRASSEGQIAADTTFDAFLKRKSKEYQDEVLGEGRAELWRSGKITLRDLVNGQGRELSLAELQAKVAANAPKPKPAPVPKAAKAAKASKLTREQLNEAADAEFKAYTVDNGLRDGAEHLAVYDALSGERFPFVTNGKKNRVDFPPWLVKELGYLNRQLVLHHNHPSSSSFSQDDLSIISDFAGAKGIWAHGHNGSSYYAEAGLRRMTAQSYNGIKRQVQQWMQSRVNTQDINVPDANLLFNHMVSGLLHKRGYIVYQAELQGETLEAFKRAGPFIEKYLSMFKQE